MTYEYECICCNNHWEVEQSIKDEPVKTCPRCKVACARRLISQGAFVLKGSGWFQDGYTTPTMPPKKPV